MQTVEIDGSLYEGGGQMIRNSIALSNILQIPFQIKHIRSGRPNPGLNNQLLTAIDLMKQITQAKVTSAKQNSQEIYYEPQTNVNSGNYQGGAKTAAAISLMFQSLLPTLIFGKENTNLQLIGGSQVNKSPPSQTIQNVLSKLLSQMGVNFEYLVAKEGFYPQGRGIVKSKIQNVEKCIKPITLLQRGMPKKIYIETYFTIQDVKVNELLKPLKKNIKRMIKFQFPNSKPDEEVEFVVKSNKIISKSFKECYAIILQAEGEGIFYDASYFPEQKHETAEECVDKAEQFFIKQMKEGGCVDEHHQDQLLIYMALADGQSQIRVGTEITPHTEGALYVLKEFIPQLKVEIKDMVENELKYKIITIDGIGFKNPNYQEQSSEQEESKQE